MRRKLKRKFTSLLDQYAAWQAEREAWRNRPVCVFVASNGRSGSTITFLALTEALRDDHPDAAAFADFVPRISDATYNAPAVYKTHDFPQTLAKWPKDTRVVFCFGSAKDSALSVYSAKGRYGEEWIEHHFHHLHATGTYDELFQRDVLQQARQIWDWATFTRVPVLCVRYEALWDHQDEIAEFTRMRFELPPKKDRVAKDIPQDLRRAADQVYDPIDKAVAELPDCFRSSWKYKLTLWRLRKLMR